jgi:hypothetical protein
MIQGLPLFISIVFGLTTVATLLLFYRAIQNAQVEMVRRKSTFILLGMVMWLFIQAIVTLQNIYSSDTNSIPPRIMLFGILPTLLVLVLLFATSKGRQFIDSLPLVDLTYLHIVRVPVEFVLLWLFLNKAAPQIMTFEGRNFDILAGISAPFIAYFAIVKNKLSKSIILIWNFICLGLLFNIIIIAIFSAPSPFQKLGFEQPNIGILNFPFSWLPTFIVPLVLFGHLTSIRQLLKSGKVKS